MIQSAGPSNAMEAGAVLQPRQAVEPVELGPSPADDVLTPEELAAWLKLPVDENGRSAWVEKNTLAKRIPGFFLAGRYWRYKRIAIEKQILATGQVLRRVGET